MIIITIKCKKKKIITDVSFQCPVCTQLPTEDIAANRLLYSTPGTMRRWSRAVSRWTRNCNINAIRDTTRWDSPGPAVWHSTAPSNGSAPTSLANVRLHDVYARLSQLLLPVSLLDTHRGLIKLDESLTVSYFRLVFERLVQQ